ncbi:putative membrane protein [Moumouvirus maliensis]|nr:putative membrane protein [Moumouvirus maliensis]
MTDINTSQNSIFKEIIRKEVEKTYQNDIKYNLRSKSRWKFIGDFVEALSELCLLASTILAFSAGFYDYMLLSYLAGLMGTISLALIGFSNYAIKESRERTKQVNILLDKIGSETIPDITINTPLTPINSENISSPVILNV